jgi:methyltransferase
MSARSTNALLVLYLAVLAIQRLWELSRSRRNWERVRLRGAREVGGSHFPLFVALHVLYPIALIVEVVTVARPGPGWPLWAAVWVVAQWLRYSAVRALGERWNVRIVVIPGEPPVRTGPYQWIAHPNYLAVALELVAAPLVFGAWRTAAAASLVNAIAMAIRIPAENRALREAGAERS